MRGGPRSAAAFDLDNIVGAVVQLEGVGDAPDPPKVLTVGMNARSEGGFNAEVSSARSGLSAKRWLGTFGGKMIGPFLRAPEGMQQGRAFHLWR